MPSELETSRRLSEEHVAANNDPVRSPHDKEIEVFDSRIPPRKSVAGEILFVATVVSSQLLTQACLAISIVPQHIIGQSYGIDNEPAVLSWFTAGYSLTVGTFILVAGRLGDCFGHKLIFIGGYIWFSTWSALVGVGVYSTPTFFIFCRAMQGIGPAFLLPNAVAMFSRAYEPGLRQNLMFSLFGATAPGGFVLGAVFSSLLSQLRWWPWSSWILSFVCLVMAALAVVALPKTPVPRTSGPGHPSNWQRVDGYGSILGVAALVLVNVAVNQGAVVGWQNPYTYSILIVGILVFLVFVLVEKRASHPLIPFRILHIDSIFTLMCISAGWASFGVYIFYSLNLLETLRHNTPLLTAAQISPVAISGVLAAGATGFCLTHFRPSIVMMISMSFFLIGGIVLATLPVNQTYWAQTFVGIILLPWGMDMSFPAGTIILSRAMPREHQGLAASLVNTFVNYSISLGLGLAGTIEGHLNNAGHDLLKGYRGAFYLGVGFSGLGVFTAFVFCLVERHQSKQTLPIADEKRQPSEGQA